MSRHEIKTRSEKHVCVVGYDHGMKTFFVQVKDAEVERLAEEAMVRIDEACANDREPDPGDYRAADRDAMVLWAGAERVGEVPSVEVLAVLLKPYAEISDEMMETLRREQAEAEAKPRTSHQINMLEFIQRQARTE